MQRKQKKKTITLTPPPLGITIGEKLIKLDQSELRDYLADLSKLMRDPGTLGLRICECCIQLTEGPEEY